MIMNNKIIRSPFFYVGDKYKLMSQLQKLMPEEIGTYIEPFVGGGSSLINTRAKKYIANDIDSNVIRLHKFLCKYSNDKEFLLNSLYLVIDKYGLSCSYLGKTVPEDLKKQYVKTYYSRFNKANYERMRNDFNHDSNNDMLLYLLLIYGFNHMIRFNSDGLFNLPVGNVDFNNNVYNALSNYLNFISENDVEFHNKDYRNFLDNLNIDTDSYIYFDPPYLISQSEYNKLWNEEEEIKLCNYLDELNSKGIKFGITNLINHKGKFNKTFYEWSKKYITYDIDSNYISFNDNTIKKTSKEVFVTNYDKIKK